MIFANIIYFVIFNDIVLRVTLTDIIKWLIFTDIIFVCDIAKLRPRSSSSWAELALISIFMKLEDDLNLKVNGR